MAKFTRKQYQISVSIPRCFMICSRQVDERNKRANTGEKRTISPDISAIPVVFMYVMYGRVPLTVA
jgi:hypothetical protein